MKMQYLFMSLIAATILTGCDRPDQSPEYDRPDQPPAGEYVTVQFRRDALGSAHTLPISPITGSINGAKVCLSGELVSVNGEWIVLEHNEQEFWIPKHAVLLIQINK
jgi:hypothetical protein